MSSRSDKGKTMHGSRRYLNRFWRFGGNRASLDRSLASCRDKKLRVDRPLDEVGFTSETCCQLVALVRRDLRQKR